MLEYVEISKAMQELTALSRAKQETSAAHKHTLRLKANAAEQFAKERGWRVNQNGFSIESLQLRSHNRSLP
jgi:hypothetical protein